MQIIALRAVCIAQRLHAKRHLAHGIFHHQRPLIARLRGTGGKGRKVKRALARRNMRILHAVVIVNMRIAPAAAKALRKRLRPNAEKGEANDNGL